MREPLQKVEDRKQITAISKSEKCFGIERAFYS